MSSVVSNKFFASNRTYKKKLLNYWIFYQPDHSGLPIVVDNLVYKIYNFFEKGALIEEAIQILSIYEKFDIEKIKTSIQFLIENGFLRSAIDPKLYTAEDFCNVNDIDYVESWLHITNNCNLKCDYCCVKNKDSSVMQNDTIEKTIDLLLATTKQYPTLKTITIKFTGGEPTLVLDKIKYFQSYAEKMFAESKVKLNYTILSNGTLITEQLIEEMKKSKIGIGISLDGFGTKGHDLYRRFKEDNSGSWNIIHNNIKKLINHEIEPYIMATISKDTCSTLKDLVSWIFENKLRVRLSIVRPDSETWTSDVGEYKEYSAILINNFEQAFTELEKPQYEVDFKHGNPLDICELSLEYPSFSACCGIGISHLVVNTNGLLSCCPMCVHEANVEPTEDLLTSMRKTFNHSPLERNSDPAGKACLSCQWFPVCVGGCPITNKRISGKPFVKSFLHDFYKYVIPRFIEFYGKKLLQNADRLGIKDFHVIGT